MLYKKIEKIFQKENNNIMNITKQRLKEIIKEEMHKLANPIDEKLTKKEKERKG